jgi:diguanylate cyclase (GGDEF)-like protein/PAS domain S-box-containing protein
VSLCAALTVVAFAVNVRAAYGPPILVVAPVVGANAVMLAAVWRAWRASTQPVVRRFWQALTVSAAISIVGMVVDFRSYLDGPIPAPSLLQVGYAVLPMLILLWALYRLPLGARSRGDRQRLLLDIATVTLGAVLFVWYFTQTQLGGTSMDGQGAVIGAVMVLISLIVFGFVKVIMSGFPAVDPVALRLFAGSLLVEIVGIVATPALADRPQVSLELVSRALTYVLSTSAAVRQCRVAEVTDTSPDRPSRRSFSVLPYVAVAGVDGLWLVTLWGQDHVRVVVGVTAVALTGLVTVRQIGAFRDNARLLDELGRHESRFRSLVQNAADVIAICGPDGQVTYISPAIRRITGQRPQDLVGTIGPTVHPEDLDMAGRTFVDVVADASRPRNAEVRLAHVDGGWRWVRITFTNLLHDPAVRGIVTNTSDITEAHAYHLELTHRATHDALTNLANRALFAQQVELALVRHDRRVSLALVDLDDFKWVNDTLGHHAGDALLVAVAERLRRGVRPQDHVARLGGDEFAVFLDDCAPAQGAATVERVLELIAEPLIVDGHTLCVTASIGIADAGPGDDADLLMRHADLALYEAKDTGKGCFARYDPAMRPKLGADTAAERGVPGLR